MPSKNMRVSGTRYPDRLLISYSRDPSRYATEKLCKRVGVKGAQHVIHTSDHRAPPPSPPPPPATNVWEVTQPPPVTS